MSDPTTTAFGDCYKAAGTLFMDLAVGMATPFPEELGEVVLVHGMPTLTIPPFSKFGHAWLELGDVFCYDAERQMVVPKAIFYGIGKIIAEECYRYDLKTFRDRIAKFGHWGPWDGAEAQPPVHFSDDDGE